MKAFIIFIVVYSLVLYCLLKKPGIALVFPLLFSSTNNIILDSLAMVGFRYLFGMAIFMVFVMMHFKPKAFEYNLRQSMGSSIMIGVLLLLLVMLANIYIVGGVIPEGHFLVNTFIMPILVFFLFSAFMIDNSRIFEQMSVGLIIFGAVFFVVFYLLVDKGTIAVGYRATIEETGYFNAITLARICGMILITGIIYSIYAKHGALKIVSIIISILSLYWLLVTSTRGVIIAVFITLALYFIVWTAEGRKRIAFVAVVSIFVGAIVFNVLNIEQFGVLDRFTDLRFTYHRMPRFFDYSRAWSIFQENILLGAGPAGYLAITGRVYPHNIFLELIAEYGLFGLGAFILIVGGGLYNAWRILYGKLFDYKINVFILLWIYFLIASMFSGSITVNRSLWVTSGIFISVIRLASIEPIAFTNDPQ